MYQVKMRPVLRRLRSWTIGYVMFSIAGGITLAELQLHPWRRPLSDVDQARAFVRAHYGTELENIEISAKDGISLSAWYVLPPNWNGRDVLLLHGVQDNREGVAGFAPPLLDRGYGVLLPDSRAHGESGGTLATYGLQESDDIHRWVDWLYLHRHSECVFGFGESMGAALVLDSLTVEDRFCAVVAESPFSSFRSVGYERAALYVRSPSWVGRTLLRLPVEAGLTYARLRYGLDFDRDNPADAASQSTTPILLIHGTKDINILPHHSELIAARAPSHISLWEVRGATHCGASVVQPELFWTRVLGWFEDHAHRPASKAAAA
jgi:dipeptidyl aminopeptidase/acylaminoacyl peptidase